MIDIKKDIKEVRNRLINYSILILLILAFPIFALSVLQFFNGDFKISLHFFEFGFILLLFLLRHKINSFIKAQIVVSLYVLAGILGVYFFGISGGYFLSVIGIALITLFYGKKYGIMYSIIASLSFVIIQLLYWEGYITRNIDFNLFNDSTKNWISAFFTLVLTSYILILSISIVHDYLTLTIKKLDINNEELNSLNHAFKDVLIQIEDSEKKYKSIFQSLEEAVIVSDDKGNVIDCNDAAIKLFGFNREFFLSINLHTMDFKYFYPDMSPMPKSECPGKKSLDTGLPYRNIEIGFESNEGIKWININSEIFNIKGYGVYLTIYDITQEKKKTEEIQIFNRYFSTFLNHITDYIYFVDKEGKIIFCSQSFAQLTQQSTWRKLIGQNIIDFIPQGYSEKYINDDNNILARGESIIGKIEKHPGFDGKDTYIQTSKWPIHNHQNEIVGIIGISRDITEFFEEKNKLQNKTNMINLLLNSTAEGIYGIDLDGNCTFVNNACLRILGYNHEEEFLGKNTHRLIHHSFEDGTRMPNDMCKIRLAISEGKGIHSEDDVFWKKDNTYIPVEFFSYPQIIDNKIVGGVVTFMDITHRKENEKKLLNYNQELKRLNTDKDNFIRILAHDIKNPLNSIIGFSEFILDNFNDIDLKTINEYIKVINDSSVKTYELMEEILLWLKVQSGKLKANPIDVELYQIIESISRTLATTAQDKLIKIENNVPLDLIVKLDINMTKTIIRNLISNAIKYSLVGGKIIISSEQNKKETKIIVKDFGIGMSEKEVEEIFHSNNIQSKDGTMGEKGTGFGLLICYELVIKQEGKIWIESQEGEGSKFIFTLPNL